jgi:hypothetical protein
MATLPPVEPLVLPLTFLSSRTIVGLMAPEKFGCIHIPHSVGTDDCSIAHFSSIHMVAKWVWSFPSSKACPSNYSKIQITPIWLPVEYIETFLYVIHYKQGKENIVVDALSWRFVLLTSLSAKMLQFEYLKDVYANDSDFSDVYIAWNKAAFCKFYKHDGYLFKESKLCVPNCSLLSTWWGINGTFWCKEILWNFTWTFLLA